MTIRRIDMFQAVCDLCGAADDRGDYIAWADHDQAHDDAVSSGWFPWRGLLFCLGCEHDLGEAGCAGCGDDSRYGWAGNCVECWEATDD